MTRCCVACRLCRRAGGPVLPVLRRAAAVPVPVPDGVWADRVLAGILEVRR